MSNFPRAISNGSASLITILKQTSPFEERVTRSGIQRDIHVVIKNSPFMIQIVVARNCDIDLNHIAFDATLLYDTEGEKGVDFVKVKPIEFKCVPNETGDQVTVELRIKVLTSQHEDMFFKVRIQGQDPVSKQDVPNLKVITAPIKVISKPEQLKKRSGPPSPISSAAPVPASKKRTVNDMVVEAVTRIEKQQGDQSGLLEKIYACVSTARDAPVNPATSWEFLPPLLKAAQQSQQQQQSGREPESYDFDNCLFQLLKVFQATDPNHRAEKVRRFARGLSVNQNENLAEMVDMLMTYGLGVDAGREIPTTMAQKGPHKHDFDKLDNFFISSAIPSYSNCHVSVSQGEEGYPFQVNFE